MQATMSLCYKNHTDQKCYIQLLEHPSLFTTTWPWREKTLEVTRHWVKIIYLNACCCNLEGKKYTFQTNQVWLIDCKYQHHLSPDQLSVPNIALFNFQHLQLFAFTLYQHYLGAAFGVHALQGKTLLKLHVSIWIPIHFPWAFTPHLKLQTNTTKI